MEIYKQGTTVYIPQGGEQALSGQVIGLKIYGLSSEYEIGYWKEKEYKTVWLFENQFTVNNEEKISIGFKLSHLGETARASKHTWADPYIEGGQPNEWEHKFSGRSTPQPISYGGEQPAINSHLVEALEQMAPDNRRGCANYHDLQCGCVFNDCEYNKTPVLGDEIIRDDFPLPNTITAKQLKDLYPDSVWGKSKLIAMLKFGCTRGNINGTEKLSKELDAFVHKELYPNGRPESIESEKDIRLECHKFNLPEDKRCPCPPGECNWGPDSM